MKPRRTSSRSSNWVIVCRITSRPVNADGMVHFGGKELDSTSRNAKEEARGCGSKGRQRLVLKALEHGERERER